jgi:hypothetical protein
VRHAIAPRTERNELPRGSVEKAGYALAQQAQIKWRAMA